MRFKADTHSSNAPPPIFQVQSTTSPKHQQQQQQVQLNDTGFNPQQHPPSTLNPHLGTKQVLPPACEWLEGFFLCLCLLLCLLALGRLVLTIITLLVLLFVCLRVGFKGQLRVQATW